MLCKYKDSLGKPREGVHSARLMDVAVFDVAGTVLAAYALSRYTSVRFWPALAFLFLAGIVLHRLFCVRTTLDKLIFPLDDPSGGNHPHPQEGRRR